MEDYLRLAKSATFAICTAVLAMSWTTTGSAQTASRNKEVVFAAYGGSLEQFVRDKVIPEFEKESGIKVRYVVGTALSHLARLISTKSNPELDVSLPTDLTLAVGKARGLYAKLDPNIVTNLAEVFDLARDPDGRGVASHVSILGLQYNKKKFAEAGLPAPTSWYDLWQPQLKGRVALYSIGITYSQDFVALLSKLEGSNETNADPAFAKLRQLADSGNLLATAKTPAELSNAMAQERAWITVDSSFRSLLLAQSKVPVAFTTPKEGGSRFANHLVVTEGAPNPEAAQRFVNFMLSEKVQSIIAESLFAAPTRRGLTMPKKFEADLPYGQEALSKLIVLDHAVVNQKLDEWVERWNREVEARLR